MNAKSKGTPQKRKPQSEFLLPADYARASGISRQRVYELMKAKRFQEKVIGRRVFIRDKQVRKAV